MKKSEKALVIAVISGVVAGFVSAAFLSFLPWWIHFVIGFLITVGAYNGALEHAAYSKLADKSD